MFTYLIHDAWISEPDSFWSALHVAILWGLGLFLDLLLIMVLRVAWLSALTLSASGRERGTRGLVAAARTMARIDRVVVYVAGAALAAMVLVTFFSVIGRTLWKPIPDDYTMAEWALVLVAALMMGVIQGRGEHIEVTAFTDNMSERTNRTLRLVGVLAGCLAVSRLAWVSIEEVPGSFLEITYGSIYDLPMWPPRLIFMMGLAWWLARTAIQVLVLPVTELVDAEAAGAPPGWDLTPLLPAHSGAEVETSGEFIDTTASDERGRDAGGNS
ncbi:TRAP-type C4-dicarboxylate transport system, small permease component [Albimonas donghaensis]|uniref:TRAP transporter small permease protein n=1 Tax=Albimonas donghaensis TaxID=356660 RepID=A0A1H2QYG2_9RHOB|nr:TRAP transporter small permease [Albimonas donghaensis]SDW11684.1 TRAP-type C4-dicarboxylate transport system, small permease component [Albimonas donghaensis]